MCVGVCMVAGEHYQLEYSVLCVKCGGDKQQTLRNLYANWLSLTTFNTTTQASLSVWPLLTKFKRGEPQHLPELTN